MQDPNHRCAVSRMVVHMLMALLGNISSPVHVGIDHVLALGAVLFVRTEVGDMSLHDLPCQLRSTCCIGLPRLVL